MIPKIYLRFGLQLLLLVAVFIFLSMMWNVEFLSSIIPGIERSNSIRSNIKNINRRLAVKRAMQHAWTGYETYAFGKDELLPVTGSFKQNWGVTLIDSLSTLYVMGMHEEFNRAKEFVKTIDFSTTIPGHHTSLFETNIRCLGGLISAYDLSGDKIFLQKAVDLADILILKQSFGFQTNIAEAGTLQLEFQRLSNLTGNREYYKKSQKVIDLLDEMEKPIPGLYPRMIDIRGMRLYGEISMGAMADSFYEYLLKLYLMYNKNGEQYRRMYEESIDSMKEHMVFKSIGKMRLTYVSELDGYGLLTLGSVELNRADDLVLAKELIETCYATYKHTKTGLGPEYVNFYTSKLQISTRSAFQSNSSSYDTSSDYYIGPSNLLRPEMIESLMIMYRVTGDEKYRDWGWNAFMSFEKYSKTPIAYSSYENVNDVDNNLNYRNSMESFFLGETLKYLYLLFSEPSVIPLNEYVFNTEAHPIKIMK
ncbi:hypothetical protein BB560_005467 [Smittium megazygosporum]|uniref:alpha-1,2-Mannosidase n=1 Tax=Smittium megazygosporum TaxID=133381 RepID=A0A2T9Z503_9FUNG|nr:hypothetical protein BB560_005467 [Smittium megazygosporum]